MPVSPELNAEGVIRISLFSAGVALPPSVQLISLSVDRAVNRVPSARLLVIDGDMPNQTFPVADTDVFKPGAEIKINAGYGDEESTIFEGIVVKLGVQIGAENDAMLVVECRDKAVCMTVGRKNANFVNKTDSEVISDLIAGHSGLTQQIDDTTAQYQELVQYYCSDWDFMLTRAEANGLLVIVTDAKVAVSAPAVSGQPTLKVSYGIDLITFEAEIDARTQYAAVQAVSWDSKNQAVISGSVAKAAALNVQGNLDSAALAKVVGLDLFRLQTAAPTSKEMLTQWARAQQIKSGLSRICGRMSFQGSAKARVGKLIELAGVGTRFSGPVFISALTHRIAEGNWVTEAQFGVAPQWFTDQPDVTAPPAAGRLPAVEGLQIGVVIKLDGDPQGEHRVQVSVPVMQAANEGVWARLLQFHGSNGFGSFFVPELGDEVVLGYFNNDPSHPVIMGSLYSSKQVPAFALSAENDIKAITTRCLSRIEFNEKDKVITITTPGKNRIVLSDLDKSIVLTDQNDNQVELKPEGITLTSPKNILLSAKGSITLDAVGAINISSKADVQSKGLNVNCVAQVGFVGKGNATAELSATGQTTVKGAMVMIN